MSQKNHSLDNTIAGEWRELGFYYALDKKNKSWLIHGSKKGIKKFIDILNDYANDIRNQKISEHEHYGPYMYLEITTGDVPKITSHALEGPLEDIRKLAKVIHSKLESNEKVIKIDKEYSDHNEYTLTLNLENDSFDPASLDKSLKLD